MTKERIIRRLRAVGVAGSVSILAIAAPLRAQSRISQDSAAKVARSEVPGGKIRSAEYEHEKGHWVWSFDLEVPGKPGIREVLVDASTGEVVALEHESAAAEAGETSAEGKTSKGESPGFQRDFDVSGCDLSTTGRSRYMVLEPGYRLTLEGQEQGAQVRLQVTVLRDTAVVDGQPTRVLEEREWHGGDLAEVSRNYVALCPSNGDVYYFGEVTDVYRDGEVVAHEGSWQAGRNGARAGLLLPGRPEVGQGYYQEVAPGRAMDRARVISTSETVRTPAGTFHDCLKTEESTPLESGEREYKLYAPGIGLLVDESLRLVGHGKAAGAGGAGR